MSQLELFKSNVQKKAYCSDDLTYGLKIRDAKNALKHRYIQSNHLNSMNYLVFDIDYAVSPCMITDVCLLPPPNLFIQNPENCHAHIAYSLASPVHLNPFSSKIPIAYASDIKKAYTKALGADQNYTGLTMKNPLHESWKVFELQSECYDLNYLADHLNLKDKTINKSASQANYGLSRNGNLFEDVRRWAYCNIKTYKATSNYNIWFEAVLRASERFNVFVIPLPYSEVKSVAKSVANWTWQHYTGDTIKRGRDRLQGALLDLKDKQVLSAVITNRERVCATEEAIIAAVSVLMTNGKRITTASVSNATTLHRNTVSKYKHLLPVESV